METVIAAMDLGAFSYLNKPLPTIRTIVEKVDAALVRARERRIVSILKNRVKTIVSNQEMILSGLERLERSGGLPEGRREELVRKLRESIEHLRLVSKLEA
jgi:hypothetical protein